MPRPMTARLAPSPTPLGQGRLPCNLAAPPRAAHLRERLLSAFARDAGHGLLQAGAATVGSSVRRWSG